MTKELQGIFSPKKQSALEDYLSGKLKKLQ
jgi:hypothetical protein